LQGVEQRLVDAARAAVGFMPDDEGLALFETARAAARRGPLLEIGTYCGKSAIYLGAAAQEESSVVFTVDHHRGSEENQAGWEHHDERLVDPRTGRMDTLPFFRRTIEDAGLEDVVVAVIGASVTVATHWSTPLGLVFIDGGHALDVALADYEAWSRHVASGGSLVFHDVFENPADGGQAPFEVWKRAVVDGFTPVSTTGSLRVLRAPSRSGVATPQ
jgi:predicted O-methyltransferase YrrM